MIGGSSHDPNFRECKGCSPVVCVIGPSLKTGEMERLLHWYNIYQNAADIPHRDTCVVLLARYSVGVSLHTFLKTRQKYVASL